MCIVIQGGILRGKRVIITGETLAGILCCLSQLITVTISGVSLLQAPLEA